MGAAGTGKSYVLEEVIVKLKAALKEVIEKLEASGESYLIISENEGHAKGKVNGKVAYPIAFTHSAAGILDGETVHRFLHEHPVSLPFPHVCWIIIDEISLCPLELFTRLVEFNYFLGVKFVVAGDFGQNLPIGEKWGLAAFLDLERCPAMHHICKGLRIDLTQCRRSDVQHFNYYTQFRGLNTYPNGQEAAFQDLLEKYPWRNEPIDICTCVSHATRLVMARLLNEQQSLRAAAEGKTVVRVSTDKPLHKAPWPVHEYMLLWEGIELLGSSRNPRPVRNQCEYTVVRVDQERVVVQFKKEPEIEMDHHTCMQRLRLACARTAASVQGLTIEGKRLLILDASDRRMDPRALYVVASRVRDGGYMHAASRKQQRQLLRGGV